MSEARRATRTARLGRSGVTVTRLALGTGPLGGWPEATDPTVARQVIEAAWDAGFRYFDTAPMYGHGLSEKWLGAALADRPRDQFAIATKVGRLLRAGPGDQPVIFKGTPPVNPVFDFTYDGVRRSMAESLERLQLDRVDVANIHDPDDHVEQALTEAHKAVLDLREAGTIRAVGAGSNSAQTLTRLASAADFDCFLLAG